MQVAAQLFTFHCGAALDGLAARIHLAGRLYATTHPWAKGKAARPPAGAGAPVVRSRSGDSDVERKQVPPSIPRKQGQDEETVVKGQRSLLQSADANAKRRWLLRIHFFLVRWDWCWRVRARPRAVGAAGGASQGVDAGRSRHVTQS